MTPHRVIVDGSIWDGRLERALHLTSRLSAGDQERAEKLMGYPEPSTPHEPDNGWLEIISECSILAAQSYALTFLRNGPVQALTTPNSPALASPCGGPGTQQRSA